MRDLIFQLKVNGQDAGKVQGREDTPKSEFIKFIKGIKPEFDETKDTLEIVNITPPETNKVLRHKARESQNNKYVDAILSRHVANLIATYGEKRLFKMLTDVHGLTKPETKAS